MDPLNRIDQDINYTTEAEVNLRVTAKQQDM